MLIRKTFPFQSLVGIGLVLLQSPIGVAADEAKNLLVVTVTKGFRHSSIPTAEAVLGSLAERHGGIKVDYARRDEELSERLSPEALQRYDAVVFANTTGELPLPDKEAFIEWVRSGKGFVGMHSASDTFHQFRPYI